MFTFKKSFDDGQHEILKRMKEQRIIAKTLFCIALHIFHDVNVVLAFPSPNLRIQKTYRTFVTSITNAQFLSSDDENENESSSSLPFKYSKDVNVDPDLDIPTIERLVAKRSEYKKKSYFEKADSIRDHLQSRYGVCINDKTMTWSTQWTKQKKSKNVNSKTNKKLKGYEQVGGPIDRTLCKISEEEIKSLLKERTAARRQQNFQKADLLLQKMKMNNIYVDDKLKEWRADGIPFDSFGAKNPKTIQKNLDSSEKSVYTYKKIPNSNFIDEEEEAFIVQKIKDRIQAKIQRNFHIADDIRDELRYLNRVEINDDERTWTVMDKDFFEHQHEYRFGGKRMANISEEELSQIHNLLKSRFNARKEKDFDKADNILQELATIHGIRVDDKKQLWHFNGRNVQKNKERKEVSKDTKKRNKKHEKQNRSEDYTNSLPNGVEISDSIPDGIFIPEESIPDGITISQESVPDGIVIPDEHFSLSDDITSAEENRSNDSLLSRETTLQSDFEALTIPILKEKLRDAGLPLSGRKAELIQRLMNATLK